MNNVIYGNARVSEEIIIYAYGKSNKKTRFSDSNWTKKIHICDLIKEKMKEIELIKYLLSMYQELGN